MVHMMAFAGSSSLFVLLMLVLHSNSFVYPDKSLDDEKRSEGDEVAEEMEDTSDNNGKNSHGYNQGADCLDIADIALVVDVSGSIEGDGKYPGDFDRLIKPFIKAFVRRLNVVPAGVQIGMVTFGNSAVLQFGLTSNINRVMRSIDRFEYNRAGEYTNTSGGIYVTRTQLLNSKDPKFRPRAPHIAVVITDGISTKDHDLTIPYAKEAQDDGIIMLAVGVTTALDLPELVGIASPLAPFNISSLENGIKNDVFTPSGTVAYVPEIDDLVDVVNRLVIHFKNTVCNATGDCPSGDMADWCNTLPTSICSNTTVSKTCCITCPQAASSPFIIQSVCNDYADIAFVADVSGSIGVDRQDPTYFDRQVKPFLRSLARNLNIGPGKIQVGMVTFGNSGYLQFSLKSDVNEVIRGIDDTVYPLQGENTNTSAGIYVMRTKVLGFDSPNYRPDAAHVAIVITDGKSTFDHRNTVLFAEDAKKQGIVIFSVGATDSIDLLELTAIASRVPGFDFSAIQDAIKLGVSGISGSVAYSPTIENLNGIVDELTHYLSRIDCQKASADVRGCKNLADFCTSTSPDLCDIPAISQICCRLCRQHQNPIPSLAVVEDCVNNAGWCTSLFPGSCYDKQTEKTCCKFCREQLSFDPKCRYGDRYNWCAPQYCWDKTVNCCRTCPEM